ncbi:hypothetical protein [Cystobacter ferrugineus]|uniref:Uncharacterized protein n=1 Tax=Cystobacter ferrugineus TaxID=83449 RepID=A0A1L9BBM6_9BACT|nr:hypothetical protein [Cystobacter ferrugineus]OJH39628.1 hypothetical protein BON30_19270 [Cystobacter ferrugineus]
MVGIFSPFMVAGLLMASPAGFTFDGPVVTARTVGNVGYFTQGPTPFSDLFERGAGSVQFSARERIADPRATYGDAGRLEATFTIGATTYRVELDQPGFPPAQAGVSRSTGPLPPPPAQPIAGGVVVNQELHGGAVLGSPLMSRVHAAAALWGVGRLWRNGQLITDTAIIHAAALSRGAHADDDTFRVLPVAREGDTELSVLVWNLPLQLEPRGFVQFDFDDVAIAVNGLEVPALAAVPTAGAFVGVAPPSTPVPGGVFLGGVATTDTSSPTSPPPQQGTGGSGVANAGQATGGLGQANAGQTGTSALDRQRVGAAAFETTSERVATATSNALPIDVAAANTSTANSVEAFLNPERVAISAQSSGGTAGGTVFDSAPAVPNGFLNDPLQNGQRVSLSEQRPPPSLNGFVPLTATAPAAPSGVSTQGSFSVVPLVPGVAAPGFAFGGDRVSTDVVATPSPLTSRAAAVPLVATPQPLNGQTALPFVSTPRPLNATPAVPLIATPPPLNTQPLSVGAPGAPAVPGSAATAPGGAGR